MVNQFIKMSMNRVIFSQHFSLFLPSGPFFKKILINHIVYSHVDSNQNTETFKLSEPEHVDDAFGDDDDGFDLLLSQIDTTEAVQSSSTFTILSKKTLHQSNGVPPKSALELPTTSKGIYFLKIRIFNV